MTARIALLALLPGVLAFTNGGPKTVPFIAWSPQSSDLLNTLAPGPLPNHAALLQDIVSHSDICAYDAVVVVDHPGVHSADLRALEPACGLATRIKDAPSARQLPHVAPSPGGHSPKATTTLLTARCGSVPINVAPGSGSSEWRLEDDKKHVLSISLPPIDGSPSYRKTVMAEHERLLSQELDRLAALAPNHLVIYAGSHLPLQRRQLPSPPFDAPPESESSAPPVIPSPQGGILHNYQLLTPALITGLLVAFFILVPIVLLGINALASIQSTVRFEAPKDYSAQERKTQ